MISREHKRDKFRKFATRRTNNVLRQLRVLGNLSNRNLYEYTDEEINKIFSEIDKKVKETKARFNTKKDGHFKL